MKTLIRTGCVVLSLSFILAFWASVGLAQTEWEKYPGNPVLDVGPDVAWDYRSISGPCILFHGGEYRMWYSGHGSKCWIGYATSPDGIVWTKYADNPVLDLGPSGAWDSDSVHNPDVHFDEGLFKMWYTGGRDASHLWIGYATSPDGIVWTKYEDNSVLSIGTDGEWDDWEACGANVLFNGS